MSSCRLRSRFRAFDSLCDRYAEHSWRHSVPQNAKICRILSRKCNFFLKNLANSKKCINFAPENQHINNKIRFKEDLFRYETETMTKKCVHTPINSRKRANKTMKNRGKALKMAIFWRFFKKIRENVCKFSELCLYLHQICDSAQEKLCLNSGQTMIWEKEKDV